jgi:hypothetical protein
MSRCLTCNCDTFEENPFKKDYCKHCLHDHSHKPAALYVFEQKKPEKSTVPASGNPTHNEPLSEATKPESNPVLKTPKKEPEKTRKKDKMRKDKSGSFSFFGTLATKLTGYTSEEKKEMKRDKLLVSSSATSSSQSSSQKKKKPQDIVISGPTGVKHVSHIGWDAQGGFEAKNLPPEWAKFFESLDQAMKKMGGKGLTKQEALYLLKFGKFSSNVKQTSKPLPTPPTPKTSSSTPTHPTTSTQPTTATSTQTTTTATTQTTTTATTSTQPTTSTQTAATSSMTTTDTSSSMASAQSSVEIPSQSTSHCYRFPDDCVFLMLFIRFLLL